MSHATENTELLVQPWPEIKADVRIPQEMDSKGGIFLSPEGRDLRAGQGRLRRVAAVPIIPRRISEAGHQNGHLTYRQRAC